MSMIPRNEEENKTKQKKKTKTKNKTKQARLASLPRKQIANWDRYEVLMFRHTPH